MKYYVIEPKYFGKREVYIIPNENVWTPRICPKCGGNNVETSVPIKVSITGTPCDFYENSGKLLISAKCLELFQKLGLTGYSVLPAEVKVEKSNEEPDNLVYYELVIDRKCGYAMDIHGVYIPKCEFCGRRFPLKEKVMGLSLNEADCDNNSIFVFDNLFNFPIVSATVKKEITKAKLSNFKFTELSQLELL